MTDKARMFRRVSGTLPEVEADVGVSFPGYYGRGHNHGTVELSVKLVGNMLHVRLHVRGSEQQTRLLEEWEFAAKELIMDERMRWA